MADATIKRLGHHGDGIADGPIYASLTLPGEVITGDIDGDRIASPSVITPSPNRVKAPCPHYKSCGGCNLMHAADPFVAQFNNPKLAFPLLHRRVQPNRKDRAIFKAKQSKRTL